MRAFCFRNLKVSAFVLGTEAIAGEDRGTREIFAVSVTESSRHSLSGYTSSNLGIDFARSQLYGVASMANISCLASSFTELTKQMKRLRKKTFPWNPKNQKNRGIRQM